MIRGFNLQVSWAMSLFCCRLQPADVKQACERRLRLASFVWLYAIDVGCTQFQLSVISALVKTGAPFADFGVWRPFGQRIAKNLKFTSWETCWRVFRTAAIMCNIAAPALLDRPSPRTCQQILRCLAFVCVGGCTMSVRILGSGTSSSSTFSRFTSRSVCLSLLVQEQ